MSAPESPSDRTAPEVTLATCTADVIELAAFRGRAGELAQAAALRGVQLPAHGRLVQAGNQLALCVRPERWLVLCRPCSPGSTAAAWQAACAGSAAAVDLSSGMCVLVLGGPQARGLLGRGWRLDLDPRIFAAGHAAASILAQVSVILAVLPSSLLLLTPATTAPHLREWLAMSARSCGLALRADIPLNVVCGETST